MSGLRVGVDVGGTFTDAVMVDDEGRLHIAKVRTTSDDLADGFLDGVGRLAQRSGQALSALRYLAHGTTLATNAIVQGRVNRAALVTNAGFRDLLQIGTQQRATLYDLWTPQPPAIVPRERCCEVRGRIGPDGVEIEPLNEDDVVTAAAHLREQDVEAIAIVLLFSFVNPEHERRVAEILARELPDVPLSLSSEVAPEFREYLRASTTALNAAVLPLVGGYVRRLSQRLALAKIDTPLHLMQSNGGVATAEAAARLPIGLLASGPAAAVIGAARLGEAVGERNLLTFDMGGTTADVAIVIDALPQLRFQGDHAGHPVNLPQIDVLSIGAGGGSIAAVDAFGSLTVGPRSAGATPGPACYGAGGDEPTVTDAHVVLGTLHPDRALGGVVELDADAARSAIEEQVGRPLGMTAEEAAEAIIRIATANMTNALRVVSVARGHDPRELALVALGGAGPMHACAIADELGTPRILIPRHPGVTSALGLLLSDVRYDLRQSWVRSTAAVDVDALDAALRRLEREAHALLARAGYEAERASVGYELDMRYRGQAYNLTVPLAPPPVTAETLAVAQVAFAQAHRRTYDFTPTVQETEIVTLRARAIGPVGHPTLAEGGDTPARGSSQREPVVWVDGERRPFALLDRRGLAEGDEIPEQTIIDQEDATILVAPGWHGTVRGGGVIVLEREGA
ncbi:MAG TPA: hydantoinase/oxoprolinase family protein [Solirubrobacteraceae bacterium]